MKKVCLLDWDNTIRPGFTLLDWVKFLTEKNYINKGYEEGIYNVISSYKKGEFDYDYMADLVCLLYAAGLTEHSQNKIKKLAKEFFQNEKLFPFAKELFNYLKLNNIETIIVSGAPIEILDLFKQKYNFNKIYGLELELNEKKEYKGSIKLNTAMKKNKRKIILKIEKEYDILISMGDSIADIPLLEKAELPIIVNNKNLKIKNKEPLYIDKDIDGKDFIQLLYNVLRKKN
jgi:HAD superfamily phosphoserine phosphatase-like hydrolase